MRLCVHERFPAVRPDAQRRETVGLSSADPRENRPGVRGGSIPALTAEEICHLESVAQRWLAESADIAEQKAFLSEALAASRLSWAPAFVLEMLAVFCAALGRALKREALCDFGAHVEAVRTLKKRFLAACAEHAEINTRLNSPAERLAEARRDLSPEAAP